MGSSYKLTSLYQGFMFSPLSIFFLNPLAEFLLPCAILFAFSVFSFRMRNFSNP